LRKNNYYNFKSDLKLVDGLQGFTIKDGSLAITGDEIDAAGDNSGNDGGIGGAAKVIIQGDTGLSDIGAKGFIDVENVLGLEF
jgi:hypothetical protein